MVTRTAFLGIRFSSREIGCELCGHTQIINPVNIPDGPDTSADQLLQAIDVGWIVKLKQEPWDTHWATFCFELYCPQCGEGWHNNNRGWFVQKDHSSAEAWSILLEKFPMIEQQIAGE